MTAHHVTFAGLWAVIDRPYSRRSLCYCESMHPVIRLVVLLLTVGLTISSYCAQACSLPQPAAPECPQHPHSGTPNCCEHSSTDATDATITVFFMPQPRWITCNLPDPMTIADHRGPLFGPSTVLRV